MVSSRPLESIWQSISSALRMATLEFVPAAFGAMRAAPEVHAHLVLRAGCLERGVNQDAEKNDRSERDDPLHLV